VDAWVAARPGLRHLRIEDGPGRPLGRRVRDKISKRLVLLRDGAELARVVRPREARDLFPLDQALPPAPGPAGVVA
jgi:thioredoxin 1